MRAFALTLGLTVLLIGALAPAARSAELGHVSGTVTYRERMALPPSATVQVQIDDVSIADAPAHTIAETTFVPNHQVPIPFHLSYSKEAINPAHDYVVRATISIDGQMRFTTDTAHPVITKGHSSHADIVLVGVAAPPTGDTGSVSLGSTAWKLVALEGHSLAGIPEDRMPYVQFDPQKKSISGFSGCNRLVGGYTSEGSSLHLNPMGMTMMACPETALSEHDFTSALESVTSYKIATGQLELLRDGKAIAMFAPFTPPGH